MTDLLIKFSSSHVVEYEDDAILLFVYLVDVDYAGVVETYEHINLVSGFDEKGLVYFGCEWLAGVSSYDSANG